MKWCMVITAFLSCQLLAQQKPVLTEEIKLPETEKFTVDHFRNLYLINNEEVKKLNLRSQEVYSYSSPILGEVFSVDVLNPLSPYVFHKIANKLVVTDNRLNENSELDFSEFGYLDVQFVSFSDQENVWFYEQISDRLYRFNIREKRQTNKSLNITQILGSENQPENMVSTVHNVYLNVPEFGILEFEATGAFAGIIPIQNIGSFAVYGDRLYGLQNGSVVIYDLKTARNLPANISAKNLDDLKFVNGRLYLLKNKLLTIYEYSEGGAKAE